MEATVNFLRGGGDGGGGSTVVSTNESIVCEAETVERKYQGPEEEYSFSGEAELELGLGLSIGGGQGCGCGRVKAGGRRERSRILTAKDFPSAVFNGGFSSSSSSSSPASIRASSSSPAIAVSGTKRAAESVSQEGGSPTGSGQVVGWPPIRTYRMSLVNQTKASTGKSEEDLTKKKQNSSSAEGTAKPGFVKVSMDGVVIGRKLDLNSHSSYQSLAQAVHHMFFSPASSLISTGFGFNLDDIRVEFMAQCALMVYAFWYVKWGAAEIKKKQRQSQDFWMDRPNLFSLTKTKTEIGCSPETFRGEYSWGRLRNSGS